MNLMKILTPAAVFVALSATALASGADQRRADDRQRGSARGSASQVTPRENRSREGAARNVGPRAGAPRQVAPRNEARRDVMPGAYGNRQYDTRQFSNRGDSRDMGRPYMAPRGAYRPSYRMAPPYRPRYFARPYYAFRPRLNLGFGLWLGFQVPYPYAYAESYRSPAYGYGYAPGAIGVAPGQGVYGGLSFEVSPADAQIFVDGEYVGVVGNFPPYAQPLTLTPGRHRIEVQADGYQPMVWDVNVVPGQVVPFQGAMRPY